MTQGPVTLFSDRHFAGSSVPLDEGDTRFPADFNDTASSIHVAPGYGAVLYEYANEYGGYGAWVDLLEDCPDLSVYGFDKKTSYVHVFRTERDGFVWARGAMRDGQFIPGHWERKRASGGSDLNSTVAVVAPPLPARTTPLPAGEGVVVRDHRGEPQQDPPGTARFATFTMDSFGISNTRSLHNDTDFVYLSATVGANPPVFAKKSVGDVNNGTHSVGLSIEVDIPDDDTIVVFNYLIMNSGHGGDDTRAKAAQAALSTVAEEIIKHKAITAGAIAVGAILVPLFVSALAAIAGVLAVVEVGLLLFADCDGLVAAGALPFTCRDLIRRTSSGQKISENADHPGIDSPAGCGSNSHYTTACTITTAPSIQTVLDLRGAWASGGVAGPFVSVTGNSISIDMSASHRPAASGRVLDTTHISVNFPDDKTYTGVLQAPNVIRWSNNSSWTKVPAIQTVIDLNGRWGSGGVLGPVITVHGNSISIDMSALKRPTAVGTVVNGSDISVTFPDDKTYSGVLQPLGTIRWSDNSDGRSRIPKRRDRRGFGPCRSATKQQLAGFPWPCSNSSSAQCTRRATDAGS